MTIAFYGEMDAFTGSIRKRVEDLPRLIRDLTILCLLYDNVVVPPGALVEHPLCLPAFQALAPFVRSGRLGTSGPSNETPLEYLRGRAERGLSRRRRGRFDPSVDAILEPWSRLLPRRFAIRRNVDTVQASYLHEVDAQLAALIDVRASNAALLLRRSVERARQGGRSRVDRNHLLAALAGVRRRVPPLDLACSLLLVQGTYFQQGSASHLKSVASNSHERGAILFPGRFARRFAEFAQSTPGISPLPIAWEATPSEVLTRMAKIGIAWTRLSKWPTHAVEQLVTSSEWSRVRPALVEPAASAGAVMAVREILRAMIPAENENSTQRPYPIACYLAPATHWQLGVTAAVGTIGLQLAGRAQITLDWATNVLRTSDCTKSTSLTSISRYAFTLLAMGGDLGLAVSDLAQGLREVDVLDTSDEIRDAPVQRGTLRIVDRNRVDQAIKRLRLLVRPFGLAIYAKRGRFLLRGPDVDLVGLPWNASEGTTPPPMLRRALYGQKSIIWRALASVHPAAMGLDAIALAVGRSDNEEGRAYVTRLAAKLRVALQNAREPWTVLGQYRGALFLSRAEVGSRQRSRRRRVAS